MFEYLQTVPTWIYAAMFVAIAAPICVLPSKAERQAALLKKMNHYND